MAKKPNAYLAKQENVRKAYSMAAETVMKQFMLDTMMIAISEEFGFGADRIERLIKRWGKIYTEYYPCLNATSSDEADVQRYKLDEQIKPLISATFAYEPFEKRYPDLKKVKY